MTAADFTLLFLTFLLLGFALGTALSLRHVAHVRACRAAVPAEFHGVIALEAHQKAADYTIAKKYVSFIESGVDVLLLLAMTLGGGLLLIQQIASRVASGPYVLGLVIFAGLS
jgi:STE24 endopeptidase